MLPAFGSGAESKNGIVVFCGAVTEVKPRPEATADLWLAPADLLKATQYELKPEGVCKAERCIPIPKGREKEFTATADGKTWFNLSEFARLLGLPAAHDAKNAVWYFDTRSEDQDGYLKSLMAPDFKLPDVDGKLHSLSDFRGKKVLLITWASW
jgi:hypothetical protein